MKRRFELQEKDIKEAISHWLSQKHGEKADISSIYLSASETYDYADRKTGTWLVNASVTVEGE